MKYVPRLNPKTVDVKGRKIEVFVPAIEEYIDDLVTIMDHIFSYEFKTHNAVVKGDSDKKETVGGNLLSNEILKCFGPDDLKKYHMFNTNLYKKSKSFPPKTLDDCKGWWDIVVMRFYQELPSVTFVVDHQEHTLEHDLQI